MPDRPMSDAALVRWSKPAAIASGVLWPVMVTVVLFASVATGAMEDSTPPPETINLRILSMAAAFYVPGIVLMLTFVGVRARYKEQWKTLGRIGLIFALVASAVVPFAAAAALGGSSQAFDDSIISVWGLRAVILGSVVLGIAFILFGIAAIRSNTPSRRFGGVMIMLGLFQPLILVVSVFRLLAYSVGWVILGLFLPSAKQHSQSETTNPK